ncbi:sodium-dependent transporter [Clostridium sp. Marseille-Q2269]|uniref:sodium-dependent transporter n=1 Tax=Clostridium sp. Marseille-Q2269 TaxID=2942205 RepID=UPI0020739F48|nr:sodium-dependent transporter [Clostridium sp. Marseille-Q2269]
MAKRENWGSKLGLILAMAGNAVGLGNFWRFPYQAAKHGGGAFMVPYIAALLLLGIPIIIIEWMQGRYGGKIGRGTVGHMIYLQSKEKLGPKGSAILGSICGAIIIGVVTLVNSYYLHIIGWSLGYSVLSITGGYMDKSVSTGQFFVNYIQSPEKVIVFWVISVAFLGFALARGVQKGIEAWAKVLMPLLYIFGFLLIFKAITLGSPVKPEWSSLKGLSYIWTPRWSELNFKTVLAACGQIFFTLSIGMGIVQNYASYLKEDDDLVVSGLCTVSLNEFAEVILGGTIVIPITYAFMGMDGLQSGVGLTFIALPNIFRAMGGGQFMGTMWFFMFFFAGVTSAIAMYNYVVAILEEEMNVSRKNASIAVFFLYMIVGLPVMLEPILTKTSELVYLSELDNWVGSYLLIVVGLIEVIVAGWLFGTEKSLEETNRGAYIKVPRWFYSVIVKFVTPIIMIVVLIGSTMDYIKEGYFKVVPSFVEKFPNLIPWVNGARVVLVTVLVIGFVITYNAIMKAHKQDFV